MFFEFLKKICSNTLFSLEFLYRAASAISLREMEKEFKGLVTIATVSTSPYYEFTSPQVTVQLNLTV